MANERAENQVAETLESSQLISQQLLAAWSFGEFPLLLTIVALLAAAGILIADIGFGAIFGGLGGLLLGLWINSAIKRAVQALANWIELQGQVLSDLHSQIHAVQTAEVNSTSGAEE